MSNGLKAEVAPSIAQQQTSTTIERRVSTVTRHHASSEANLENAIKQGEDQ
jgi:hypothetical protein